MKKYIYIVLSGLLCLIYQESYSQISTNEKPISFVNTFAKASEQNIPNKVMPSLDMVSINREDKEDDSNGVPPRFGYSHPVNYNLNNSGQWVNLPDGSRLWRLSISCPNALSINLLYDKFWLPNGSKFFVYSYDKKHALGAFTSANNKGTKDNVQGFATGLVYGDKIVLEYYEPKNVRNQGIISIAYVVQGYRYINIYNGQENFGFSGSCQVNINCIEGQNWQNEKNAVALILVNGNRYCTGSLINTTANDKRPLFLTADHCLGDWANGKKYDAISDPNLSHWSFYWNYEAPGCSNPTEEPPIYSTVGANVVANNSVSDFALISLQEDPKNNSNIKLYYLGWDRSGNSGNGGVGIHHPRGDVKKIATLNTATNNNLGGDTNYWSHYWNSTTNGYSVTEGGSSGSPLINDNRRIIGQLYGGSSINCSNPSQDIAVYGKFSVSWTGNGATDNRRKLQPWLDPQNTGTIVLDGMGGNALADLYVRDSVGDIGDEPSGFSRLWASPDIWIEDMAGNRVNPYGDDDYNVCVRIHNRSDSASLGNERLLLNWAKAGIDLNWSGSWTGKEFFNCNGKQVPKGGYVGDINGVVIPSIPAHSNYVIKVKWHVPKPEDYSGCSAVGYQLRHFCLLARVYDGHPILHENESSISVKDLVRDNNNVAWRNITILEGKQNRGAVSVGNSFKEPRTFSLSYSLRYNGLDEQLLYNFADVYLNMSSNLFELWQKSDFAGKGFKVVDKNKILLTEPTATIERLVLQPEELYLLEAEVNFFTQEKPENNEFVFDIAEYVDDEKGGKELIGGETYIAIRNSERDSYFKAKAVDDKTVLPAEPVSFRAEPISEDAVYTWFDQKGDTVARGLNLTVTPTSTQHYKLEVVATADGFKDYDSVRVTVRNGAIVSLSPNPTDNQLTITYRLAAGITNATIEISDVQNLSVQSYPVTAAATAKTVSLAGLTAGTYVVKLIINGETVDTQQVIKN